MFLFIIVRKIVENETKIKKKRLRKDSTNTFNNGFDKIQKALENSYKNKNFTFFTEDNSSHLQKYYYSLT
jgi:hypothetical protein